MKKRVLSFWLSMFFGALGLRAAATQPATQSADLPMTLPGEQSAADVLDGKYPYPPSPAVESHTDDRFLDSSRITLLPPPGVHPRVLCSPQDLPDLRKRLRDTEAGRSLFAAAHALLLKSIGTPNTPGFSCYEALARGDVAEAKKILLANPTLLGTVKHYDFYMPTCLELTAFEATINQDQPEGKKVAAALTAWIDVIRPDIETDLGRPLADDVFRITATPDEIKADPMAGQFRPLLGYATIGFAYDFAFNFMTDAQRKDVRSLIAEATRGRLWMGARLPHHFRNWNWIEIGLSQPLLSLSIEGEEGYDPRPLKLGIEIENDYFNYGLSPQGSATEAVGYMNFGLVWGNVFAVAAQRRGGHLMTHSHYRALPDWFLQSMQPFGATWESHGDGGDSGPQQWMLAMLKYFYPTDPRTAALWQNFCAGTKDPYLPWHCLEQMIWASDLDAGAPAPATTQRAIDTTASLNLPLTFFDRTRSSLNARSGWDHNATSIEFECRTDSVGASHEHADRGNFTLSALGREWSHESFRSIETRYHSCILIDGLGQGFWPGPGRWVGLDDQGWALTAACDASQAYDWRWFKEITTEDPSTFVRFRYPRWMSYVPESVALHQEFAGIPFERDTRPGVVAFWEKFVDVAGGPRLWDEDSWPTRVPHNPVARAFRTLCFVRGDHPYVLVDDDIQKDKAEHLYEWLMLTGPNTDLAKVSGDDLILCDADVSRDKDGTPHPQKGAAELLVRILQANTPAKPNDFQRSGNPRLEILEKKDLLEPAGGRSFGLDRRLVIPSRSVAPDFKILLFPLRAGQALPSTQWADDTHTSLTISSNNRIDHFKFTHRDDGRTGIRIERDGQTAVEPIN
jgi:hypothetical protein